MRYSDAVKYLETSEKGTVSDKDKFGEFLESIGNPQDNLEIIHIGGTNGKGSTLTYLTYILKEAGYKVSTFVGPYIDNINERFQINNISISDQELVRYTEYIEEASIEHFGGVDDLSPFEKIAALSFLYSKDQKVDFMILEVGIGGANDVTNIVNSLCSIITTIGYDHRDILGEDLKEIAKEKSGIIKDGHMCFTMRHEKSIDQIFEKRAEEVGATIYYSDMIDISDLRFTDIKTTFDISYKDIELKDVNIYILGRHQVSNVKVALTALIKLWEKGIIDITEENIISGLSNARWQGRLELLRKNPRLFVDGAHNVQALETLRDSLEDFEYDKLIVVFGVMVDKEVNELAPIIESMADTLVLTKIDYYRAMDTEVLSSFFDEDKMDIIKTDNVKEAVEESLKIGHKNDILIFCGSLYLAGEVRNILKDATI